MIISFCNEIVRNDLFLQDFKFFYHLNRIKINFISVITRGMSEKK